MNDVFIQSIYVHSVRNITDFEIKLSDTERQHLIITGKNGSGKTSLLEAIDTFIYWLDKHKQVDYGNWKNKLYQQKTLLETANNTFDIENIESEIQRLKRVFNIYGGVEIEFTSTDSFMNYLINKKYIIVFFGAKRQTNLQIPVGINKITLGEYNSKEKLNVNFIQYIVNLRYDRLDANADNDTATVEKIEAWFTNFENRLKELFDAPDLQLIFNRKNYNFQIKIGNQEPFDFTQLSDGYSAVMSIVTELILRMEATGHQAYDVQGIVLIDEIETHLHVALQKNILPFLCDFFPKIQFIVTTHSPFVLSSVSNAVICDLQQRIVTTDLSAYSWQSLIESYFDTDQYSETVKEKIRRFEQLTTQSELSETEEDEYYELKRYFKDAPKFYSKELELKLLQIADLKRTPKTV